MRTYFGQIADQKYTNKENAERIFSLLIQNIGNIKEGSNVLLAFLGHPKYYKFAVKRFPKCKIFILEDVSSKQCYDFCSYIPKSDIIYIDFNDKKYLYYIENLYKLNMGFEDKKFDIIIGNPPYNKNLHLRIIEKVITLLKEDGKGCFIHPARWIEDILAVDNKKEKSNYKKFYNSIVKYYEDYDLIDSKTANCLFNIGLPFDLMISCFSKINNSPNINIINDIALTCYNKIINKINLSLFDKIEFSKIDGYRVEVKKLVPAPTNGGDSYGKRMYAVEVVKGQGDVVFENGMIPGTNTWWCLTRGKNKWSKKEGDPIPNSIRFDTLQQATNFAESLRTKFYKNYIHLIKWDVNVPLKWLPYIVDDKHGEYEKPWTDEDYCKYFELNEEETQFMCREVDDYRIKDFINYTEI